MNRFLRAKAFSLVEVLITVTLIGVMGAIAYAVIGDTSKASREQKLTSDANTLNRAVQVYLASGGTFDGSESADDVIGKLKTVADAGTAMRLTGLSSSLVDPRLTVRYDNGSQGRGELLAAWDSNRQRFVTGGEGADIAEFVLDESLAETAPVAENRSGRLMYAKDSTWIWDYQDRAMPAPAPGPTMMAVVSAPLDAVTLATPLPPPPAPPMTAKSVATALPSLNALAPPIVVNPGAAYPIDQYDFSVSITNPNPSGSSTIVFAIDYGDWQDYSGPITVRPDTVVSAQSLASSADWTDSSKADHCYLALPITLSPPSITTSSNLFGLFFNRIITVAIADPNKAEAANIEYRVNGEPWTPYLGPFDLNRWNYLAGANIEARAVSAGSPYYLDSVSNVRFLPNTPLDLTGSAEGMFHDPIGQANMVTNLTTGDSDSLFQWGDLLPLGDPRFSAKSWMQYDPGRFSTATPGDRFQIGSLSYYNGSILSKTGADTVDLDIQLDLNVNGTLFNPSFDFTFELVNTVNAEDPLNPWPDADFVRFASSTSNRTIVINDYEYEFRIEFGNASSDGFANFNEFHVLENEMASVQVFGTFIEIGKVSTASTLPKWSDLTGMMGMNTDDFGTSSTPTVYQIENGVIVP